MKTEAFIYYLLLNLFIGWPFHLFQFGIWYINNLGGYRAFHNFFAKDFLDINYGPIEWVFPFLECDVAWVNNYFFKYYYSTDFDLNRVIFAGDKSVFDKSIFGNKSVSVIAQGP